MYETIRVRKIGYFDLLPTAANVIEDFLWAEQELENFIGLSLDKKETHFSLICYPFFNLS